MPVVVSETKDLTKYKRELGFIHVNSNIIITEEVNIKPEVEDTYESEGNFLGDSKYT